MKSANGNWGENLHPVFWLWIPLAFFIVQVALEILLSAGTLSWMQSEGGPHELAQFLLLLTGFIVAMMAATRLRWSTQKSLMMWILLAAACCFYVGGEEISWGQQLLHWDTPEHWSAVNDQNETNLHNTSSWFDQKPRLILLLGVLFGGLIFPFLQKVKPGLLPEKFSIIYPPRFLTVISALLLSIVLLDFVDEAMKDVKIFERSSEVEELYMFYFVLLYLVVLRRRILQNQR